MILWETEAKTSYLPETIELINGRPEFGPRHEAPESPFSIIILGYLSTLYQVGTTTPFHEELGTQVNLARAHS